MCNTLYITLQPYMYQNKHAYPTILYLSSQFYVTGQV